MRTTMNLPDDLYRAVRIRAAEEGRTVTSLLEQALRALLDEEAVPAKPFTITPIPMGIPGDPPFDLNDNSAILDYLDAHDDRADS